MHRVLLDRLTKGGATSMLHLIVLERSDDDRRIPLKIIEGRLRGYSTVAVRRFGKYAEAWRIDLSSGCREARVNKTILSRELPRRAYSTYSYTGQTSTRCAAHTKLDELFRATDARFDSARAHGCFNIAGWQLGTIRLGELMESFGKRARELVIESKWNRVGGGFVWSGLYRFNYRTWEPVIWRVCAKRSKKRRLTATMMLAEPEPHERDRS